jgi:hypothetical protein
MPSWCGKAQDNLRLRVGKICVHSSTDRAKSAWTLDRLWVTWGDYRQSITSSFTPQSTCNFLVSPLVEYKFYTLSTAPITTTTNLRKENNN